MKKKGIGMSCKHMSIDCTQKKKLIKFKELQQTTQSRKATTAILPIKICVCVCAFCCCNFVGICFYCFVHAIGNVTEILFVCEKCNDAMQFTM